MVDKTRKTLLCLLLALASIVVCSCAKPEQPLIEEPAKPQDPAPSAPSQTEALEVVKIPPPQPGEVEAKVKVVFGEAALAERNRNPYFFVGDFNGDKSTDLAVVLKPAPGKLDELNGEYPKWMTRDPLSSVLQKPVVVQKQPSQSDDPASARGIPVSAADTLLAVIHGHGPQGWRDAEATQTYLLKYAVGEGMRTRERKDVERAKGKPMPPIEGDVIDQRLVGQSGFLYFSYTAMSYQWYDPVHYAPGVLPGPVHGMKMPKDAGMSSGPRQRPGMASKAN